MDSSFGPERRIMVAYTTRKQLHECLNNVDYPAAKDDLVRTAVENGCDEETVRALRAIPPETYANFSEVLASVPLADGRLSPAEKAEAHRIHTHPRLADSAKDIPPNPIAEELGENRKS